MRTALKNATDRYLKAAEETLMCGNGLSWLGYRQSEKYHSMFPNGFSNDADRCLALCFLAAMER